MAVKEEFEILIDKDGALHITAKGFRGRECEIPLRKLQELLKADPNIQFTEEYRRAMEKSEVETKVKEK